MLGFLACALLFCSKKKECILAFIVFHVNIRSMCEEVKKNLRKPGHKRNKKKKLKCYQLNLTMLYVRIDLEPLAKMRQTETKRDTNLAKENQRNEKKKSLTRFNVFFFFQKKEQKIENHQHSVKIKCQEDNLIEQLLMNSSTHLKEPKELC